MLEQTVGSEQTQLPVIDTGESPATLQTESHTTMLVDSACTRLYATLPAAERRIRRDEMRSQLQSLTDAYQELGHSEDEAVSMAVEHYRRSHTASQSQATVSTASMLTTVSTVAATSPSARKATLLAFGLFGSGFMADAAKYTGQLWETHFAKNDVLFYRLEALLFPLLAGLMVGLLAKARPVKGVLNAMVILSFFALWLPSLVFTISLLELSPNVTAPEWFANIMGPFSNPLPGLVGLVCWPPLGILGASLGGWIRNKAGGKRQRN